MRSPAAPVKRDVPSLPRETLWSLLAGSSMSVTGAALIDVVAAIVVTAALYNALRVVKKDMRRARIVINGAGAAAVATYRMLLRAGIMRGNVIMLDSKGILHRE